MVSHKMIINGNTSWFYDEMYDFLVDEKADLSHQELTEEIADLPFVEEVYPVNAHLVKVYDDRTIEFEGYTYVMVALEDGDGVYLLNRYLLKEALQDSVYINYHDKIDGKYITDGKIYGCRDEAIDEIKIDVKNCSDEEFDSIMLELVAQEMAQGGYGNLLQIKGVAEPLREYFNNDVLRIWRERKQEKLYEGRC